MLVIPGGDLRADRAPPLPRDPPRRHARRRGRTTRPAATGRAERRRPGARASSSRRRAEAGSGEPRSIDERREQFKRYKEDVKRAREAVLPVRDVPRHGDEPRRRVGDHRARRHLVLHGGRAPSDGGLARPALRRPGRPGHDQFVPRPGLVLLLPLLPAADLQVAEHRSSSARSASRRSADDPASRCRSSTCGRERRLSRRPVAIVAVDPRRPLDGRRSPTRARRRRSRSAARRPGAVPKWAEEQGFADDAEARRGREALRQSPAACNCHTYLGAGSSNLGAPDLTAIGTTGRTSRTSQATSRTRASSGTTSCRRSRRSARTKLHQLGVFLEASKGPK